MKLLKVYRTEQDLVIETSEGNRYCRLFAGRWINIDDLEKQCQELIGCNVITTAKWGYSEAVSYTHLTLPTKRIV